MKKIIVLLFSFILLTSLTACFESPDKLYGFYKNLNDKQLDQMGRIETLSITKDKIQLSRMTLPVEITKIDKQKNAWVITGKGQYGEKIIVLEIIDENTIKYMYKDDEKSVRKFIKITEEEFNRLQEIQKSNYPSLF